MSIRSNGGPKGPKNTRLPSKTTAQTSATSSRTGAEKTVRSTPPTSQPESDAFETQSPTGVGRLDPTQLASLPDRAQIGDLLSAAKNRPHLAEEMCTAIASTCTQLNQEYGELKNRSQVLVGRLTQQEVSADSLRAVRPELIQLRGQMSTLKARLNQLQRRLKSIRSQAFQIAPTRLDRGLSKQISQVAQMEPGVTRAMAALELATHFSQDLQTQGGGTLRISMQPAQSMDRQALGQCLAEIMPQAAIAQATMRLMRDPAEMSVASKDNAPSELQEHLKSGQAGRVMRELHRFHDAQVGPIKE